MSCYTESRKISTYKYRETHHEHWKAYLRLKYKEYYNDEAREKKRLYYLKKKEQKLEMANLDYETPKSLGITI
jgi:hypothetical protein